MPERLRVLERNTDAQLSHTLTIDRATESSGGVCTALTVYLFTTPTPPCLLSGSNIPSPASLHVDNLQDRWSEGAVQCFHYLQSTHGMRM